MSIKTDILLVGGGVMSATLATLLHALDESLNITMIEQLSDVALESSDALNNAGTGHAGYCELNYTPEQADGSIAIHRALAINANFETSLQFWASLVENSVLPSPETFITKTPHLSFVQEAKHIDFLKRRHATLSQHHLFADMQYSESYEQLKQWIPLLMENRSNDTAAAATYVEAGTDVNFGALTRSLIQHLKKQANFDLLTENKASALHQLNDVQKRWRVKILNTKSDVQQEIDAKFVFLGAGGGALPLLQKSNIPESKGYGGFPVSGQWLICKNQDLVAQHQAKVYSMAPVGAPPMSVPHLDTRIIDGERALLFGPYAGFTTKFLKESSKLDLLKSVKHHNLKSLLGVAKHNADLTKYLIKEASQTHEQRMASLRHFLPEAKSDEWSLCHAGQRVQIIKSCKKNGGKLEFGTEIVSAQDGSIAALLGASPGASVSVQAMLDVLEKCFPEQMKQQKWQEKLRQLIPSYGQSLIDDKALLTTVRARAQSILL